MKIIDRVLRNEKQKEKFKTFFNSLKQEGDEYKEMYSLIVKYLENGKLTKEEYDKIREQLIDTFKISGHVALFLLPFGSLLVVFLIKMSERLNIDILPSSFKNC